MMSQRARAEGRGRGGRLRFSALAALVLTPALSLGLVASPSYAWGSSISTPTLAAQSVANGVANGWTAADIAWMQGVGISSSGITGAAASAPVAAVAPTAAATATGASTSVWGAVTGKIAVLLGGVGAWKFIAPTSTSALPAGSLPSLLGDGYYWSSVSVTFGVQSTMSITLLRPHDVGGVECYGIDAAGSVFKTHTSGSMAAYFQSWTWHANISNPGKVAVGGVCARGPSGNNSYPAAPTMTGQGLVDWAPGGASNVLMRTGSFPGVGAVNPTRHIEQTVTCKTAAGTTTTATYVGPTATWSGSQLVDVAGLMCPSGSRAVGVTATVKTTGGADLLVIDKPYAAGTGLDSNTSNVPEPCYSGTACGTRVQTKPSPGSTTWTDTGSGLPEDWWTDPNRDVIYRCVYGAVGGTVVVIPMAECSVYKTPGTLSPPVVTTPDPPANSDDCTFGFTDLLTGGIFLRGSKCVVRWAFTPTPGTVDALYSQIQVRAPFSVGLAGLDGADAMVTAYNGAGSCGSIADFTTSDINGLIECDAFSKIPGASALRALVGVVLVTLTGLSVVNMATARFSGGAS